jgi:hypothetical protein
MPIEIEWIVRGDVDLGRLKLAQRRLRLKRELARGKVARGVSPPSQSCNASRPGLVKSPNIARIEFRI